LLHEHLALLIKATSMSHASPSPSADPAGLGFAAFGLTTVLLSLVSAGLLPSSGIAVVLPLALVFGGLVRLVVGVCEFRLGTTFGVTASTSYSAFWLWFALMNLFADNHLIDLSAIGPTVGAALLLWGVLTMLLWVSTFRMSRITFVVFLTLWLDYLLLGLGAVSGSAALPHAGGWLGILCRGSALYGSFGIVTNATFGRTVVPVGRPLLSEHTRTMC
jgi:succinate-acetate transporter protein